MSFFGPISLFFVFYGLHCNDIGMSSVILGVKKRKLERNYCLFKLPLLYLIRVVKVRISVKLYLLEKVYADLLTHTF